LWLSEIKQLNATMTAQKQIMQSGIGESTRPDPIRGGRVLKR
jgi:hypothetical protein